MRKPVCSKHTDRDAPVRLCHTCQRIAVEQEIAVKVVDALLDAGYTLNTDIGDGPELDEPTDERDTILNALFQGDEDRLLVTVAGIPPTLYGWVYFVYGNDGYDVVSDYTTNLEAVLKPANDFADTLFS